ncbi:DEAD/DEAH box helicase family protein [Aliivibrio salmonicida]|uniref:DEAD/DEAH box helicase family protein n=1 Tax=Aliivibrio salmonicida TaxID=40269 RepID=UPI00406C0F47
MPNIPLILDHDVLTTGGENDHLLDQLKHAISHATEIEIAVSFIQPSGLSLILPTIQESLERQELRGYPLRLRILTSDYLHITHPTALRSLLGLNGQYVDIKIFETKNHSFHMKSYIFVRSNNQRSFFQGSAFIGSNNISKTALTNAHEWCLRYDYLSPDESKEALQFHIIRKKFNDIFTHSSALTLTDKWVDNYIKCRKKPTFSSVQSSGFIDDEDEYAPNTVQEEALQALSQTRQIGKQGGLVVLGTGMGKTWLSAFDAKQMGAKRILFIAHREEILTQAFNTYAKLWPEKSSDYYHGKSKNSKDALHKDMLFASVQTLSRENHLNRFEPTHFDYIIIDEFHHASAQTYIRIISYFEPRFLLGLTATPERTDQSNILSLCHDNLIFERNLVHGIDEKILVPFHYYGIWDEFVNYDEIPWRNGKFEPNALDAQFATQKRAQHVFKHWKIHQQSRTLAFCISTKHADFMAEAFNNSFSSQGLKAVSVHSHSKVLRNDALDLLNTGNIHIIFSVDLFNEGTDLPSIDTILMLRPTESNVIFLQQLGRGLRLYEHKKHLVVLDFIGNHQSFLNKGDVIGVTYNKQNASKTQIPKNKPKMGDGCYVNIDPRITNFWEKLIAQCRHSSEEEYLNLEAHLGHRPNATEFYRAGYDISKVNKQHNSWFQLVAKHIDDTTIDTTIKNHHEFLLHAVQNTSMTKSFKAILLEAFLELDGFRTPPTIEELSNKSWTVLSRYPFLKLNELPKSEQLLKPTDNKWISYWLRNPINASISADKKTNISWFKIKDNHLKANFLIDDNEIDLIHTLVKELVDLRLAQYLDKKQLTENLQPKKLEEIKSNVIKLPYYPDIKIACGHFKTGHHHHCEYMNVDLYNIDSKRHFLAHASGDSMNGGKNPIHNGDLLLLETITSVNAGSITGTIMAIEIQDESGDNQYLLRIVEKHNDGSYWLKAKKPNYETIPANDSMKTFARLKNVIKT